MSLNLPSRGSVQGIISVCTPEHSGRRAKWVLDRCAGPLFTLNRWVPSGFDRYVQICPPAWQVPEEGSVLPDTGKDPCRPPWWHGRLDPIRWSEVAAKHWQIIDEHTKFSDLVAVRKDRTVRPGDVFGPLEETPTADMIDAVAEAVLHHSGADSECIVAVWESYVINDSSDITLSDYAAISVMGQQTHYVFGAKLGTVFEYWRSLLPDRPVSESTWGSLSTGYMAGFWRLVLRGTLRLAFDILRRTAANCRFANERLAYRKSCCIDFG